MPAVSIVFPHQLHAANPALAENRPVYLVEESLFFSQYRFHKQKLVFHRASMQAYRRQLEEKGLRVHLVEAPGPLSDIRLLLADMARKGIGEIHVTNPTDDWLMKRLRQHSRKEGLRLMLYDDPQFLDTVEEAGRFFLHKKNYFQTDFYVAQRKKWKILLDPKGRPLGGKWTFDAENRSRFPRGEKAPALTFPKGNPFVDEAIRYVDDHYGENPGASTPFHYPVTQEDARAWLDEFLERRFHHFGVYEDAMVKEEHYLHHSVLSPLLNCGLLSPRHVIEKALEHAARYHTPLNSVEGFLRQITGWREFIRIVYEREGGRQRTRNYWNFRRKIPASFWTGNTGIPPVDTVIKKVLDTGYAHHIERLMVLGNFMLLCEFDPDEVYRWFMELFIDSYDWVMVPNVYGMTQFADGGLMTTKPYISGSNYLLKMGDWDKGPWQDTWDALFWRFMHVHRDFFSQNPRLGMLLKTFDRMDPAKRARHLETAGSWLRKLDQ